MAECITQDSVLNQDGVITKGGLKQDSVITKNSVITQDSVTTTYKSITTDPVPAGLRELAAEITTAILIAKPVHIYSFIADFLQELLLTRDSNVSPSHRMIRAMLENELTYEAMLKRWGVSTALANFAATIIQAVYRGYRVRKTMPKKKKLEVKATVAEERSEESSTDSVERDEVRAAICIQRNFRTAVKGGKYEKPPGEPQQRRRPRVPGVSNPRHPSGISTAPAELTYAYETTTKEASVVADPHLPEQQAQSSPSIPALPRPPDNARADSGAQTTLPSTSPLLQGRPMSPVAKKSKQAVATSQRQGKQTVATSLKKDVKQTVATAQKQPKQTVATPKKQKSKQSVDTSQNQVKQTSSTSLKEQNSKQSVDTPQNQVKQTSSTSLKEQNSKQSVDTPQNQVKQTSSTSLKEQNSKQSVGTPEKEAKQPVAAPKKQESKQTVATCKKQESKQTVATCKKQESKQRVATPKKQESKQTVAAPKKQESKQTVAAPKKQESKQTVAAPKRQESKQTVATCKKQASKQRVATPPQKQSEPNRSTPLPSTPKHTVSISIKKPNPQQSDVTLQNQVKQNTVTPDKQDSKQKIIAKQNEQQTVITLENQTKTAPLGGKSKSVAVVEPILDSLMWFVIDKACNPGPVETTSSEQSAEIGVLQVLPVTPQLESLYSPSTGPAVSPAGQNTFSLKGDGSSVAMLIDKFESSVMEPPSRVAIGIESQEFYQARDSLSVTGNESSRLLLLNRSSYSIQTGGGRAVALRSEVDLTRSPPEVAGRRTDGDLGNHVDWDEGNHVDWAEENHVDWAEESEYLLATADQVDIDFDRTTFDQINGLDDRPM